MLQIFFNSEIEKVLQKFPQQGLRKTTVLVRGLKKCSWIKWHKLAANLKSEKYLNWCRAAV